MFGTGNMSYPGNAILRGLDIGTRHLEKDGAPEDKLKGNQRIWQDMQEQR